MVASAQFFLRFAMLDHQVLVLNRLWQAINVCTVRRAFTLLCAGHAQVVYSNERNSFFTHDFESWRDFSSREPSEEMVHTISFKIRVPKVIVLLLFDRMPRKEVKFTRHNIFERDKNTCQYCGISTSIMCCRATKAERPPGKTLSVRALPAIREKATGYPTKQGCISSANRRGRNGVRSSILPSTRSFTKAGVISSI